MAYYNLVQSSINHILQFLHYNVFLSLSKYIIKYLLACDANYTFPYWGTGIQYTISMLLPAQPASRSWEFRQTQLVCLSS